MRALLDRRFGQANQHGLRYRSGRYVHFDLHLHRFNSQQRQRLEFSQHEPRVPSCLEFNDSLSRVPAQVAALWCLPAPQASRSRPQRGIGSSTRARSKNGVRSLFVEAARRPGATLSLVPRLLPGNGLLQRLCLLYPFSCSTLYVLQAEPAGQCVPRQEPGTRQFRSRFVELLDVLGRPLAVCNWSFREP